MSSSSATFREPDASEPSVERLGTELMAMALRQVRVTYRDYNESLFGGRLTVPQIEWSTHQSEWGAWLGSVRTLRLNERLLDEGWGLLTEVLKHEMAHQYVEEILGLPDGEGPHGSTFRKVCGERGIDAAAAGHPQSSISSRAEVGQAQQRVLQRISHLLSLAQSDNQHEAQTAMASARRLMLKYNLEAAVSPEVSDYGFRHLGAPTGRRMPWQRVLANILSDYFFVEVIIVPVYRPREKKRGSVIEVCGTATNLEIAAYTYEFLERSALELWKKHKREKKIRSDRDKQSFLYGVMTGFSEKLDRDSRKTQTEGLIWLGDPDLLRYFRARHPHVRHVSGRGTVKKDAYAAGHDAGGRLVLHRGVQAGSSGGTTRLLGRGGSG